jgi:hypothetical protein
VKSKKYVVPLAVLSPELTAGLVVAYLTDGRFKTPKDAVVEMVPGGSETKPDEPVPAEPSTRRPLTSPDVPPTVVPTASPAVAPTTLPAVAPATPQ